jgi:hypothetical protein
MPVTVVRRNCSNSDKICLAFLLWTVGYVVIMVIIGVQKNAVTEHRCVIVRSSIEKQLCDTGYYDSTNSQYISGEVVICYSLFVDCVYQTSSSTTLVVKCVNHWVSRGSYDAMLYQSASKYRNQTDSIPVFSYTTTSEECLYRNPASDFDLYSLLATLGEISSMLLVFLTCGKRISSSLDQWSKSLKTANARMEQELTDLTAASMTAVQSARSSTLDTVS